MGIPLVFYGEHEAEYGSAVENNDESIQDNKFYSDISFFVKKILKKNLLYVFTEVRSDFYLPVTD